MSDIVIIEDESVLREVLAEGLAGVLPDLSFGEFGSVEEAVEKIDQGPPRLVISDVRLPGKSGVDFLIDAQKRWPETRFILMTAFATLVSREQASEYGALRLLRKPFALQELVQAIQEALRQDTFSGKFRGISLIDLMQVINLGQKTLAIFIQRGTEQAALYFEEGEILHAEAMDLRGIDAFNKVVRWQGGAVDVRYGLEPSERSIRLPFQHMILEALRLIDHENQDLRSQNSAHGNGSQALLGGSDAAPETPTTVTAFGDEAMDSEMTFTDLDDALDAISDNAVQPPDDLLETTKMDQQSSCPGDLPDEAIFFLPLTKIQGFLAAALVDSAHGAPLGMQGFKDRVNGHTDQVISGVVQILRTHNHFTEGFQEGGEVEDILISLGNQYHILKPLDCNPTFCVYAVFDRRESSLPIIRSALQQLESQIFTQ